MANYVYMHRNKWTGLLDAIRTKGGTSAALTVDGATQAVNDIETGGGGEELVQKWTYDKLCVADLGLTIPAYSTTATTFINSGTLTPQVTGDFNNYVYLSAFRQLAYPIYEGLDSGTRSGSEIYYCSASMCETCIIPKGEYNSDGITLASNQTINKNYNNNFMLYWSSANNINTAGSYGVYLTPQGVTVSNNVLTHKTPTLSLRGSSTYMKEYAWQRMTDIRYQYVIEVYRVPIRQSIPNNISTAIETRKILDCINNNNMTLT